MNLNFPKNVWSIITSLTSLICLFAIVFFLRNNQIYYEIRENSELLKCGFLKKSFIMNAPSSLFGAFEQQKHQKVTKTEMFNCTKVHS